MAGKRQFDYCLKIKERFPDYFKHKTVLDVGSMDINGNNRFLFEDCEYIGLDIGEGENVDMICYVHKYFTTIKYDTIISTEMLEHDKYWGKSLKQMFRLLKNEGLLLITAATTGRAEHGTYRNEHKASPYTNDYYRNITTEMMSEGLDFNKFIKFKLDIINTNIFFWGIKNEN